MVQSSVEIAINSEATATPATAQTIDSSRDANADQQPTHMFLRMTHLNGQAGMSWTVRLARDTRP